MEKFKRTSKCASGNLTNEEKQKMSELVKKWTKIAFRTERIETSKIIPAIEKLYSVSSLKTPKIVIVQNPFVASIASGIASAWWYLKEKGIPTGDATGAATGVATGVATGGSWVLDLCKLFLGEQWEFGISCINNIFNIYQGGNHWAADLSYYEAMRDVLNLKGLDCWEKYSAWEEAGLEGSVRFMHSEFCIVSDFPESIKIDEQNRPHSIEGASHEWGGAFRYYYVKGLRIDEKLFKKLQNKEYTFKDFISEKNEEIKSACIAFMEEKWGSAYIYDFFKEWIKEIDTYVDKKDKKYLAGTTGGMNIGVYTYFKGEIEETEIAFVRCYCPSTDRMFFLPVHPENKNAKDAIASLYRVPKKLKNEITSIQRQGEIFSTNFTEKGLIILKQLSNLDIQDTVSIIGNKYFELLQYEF